MFLNENEYLINLTNLKNNKIKQIEQMLNVSFMKEQIKQLSTQLNKENWKNNETIALFNNYQNKLSQWEKLNIFNRKIRSIECKG